MLEESRTGCCARSTARAATCATTTRRSASASSTPPSKSEKVRATPWPRHASAARHCTPPRATFHCPRPSLASPVRCSQSEHPEGQEDDGQEVGQEGPRDVGARRASRAQRERMQRAPRRESEAGARDRTGPDGTALEAGRIVARVPRRILCGLDSRVLVRAAQHGVE